MKKAIMLTKEDDSKIIIGVDSIIKAYEIDQDTKGYMPQNIVGYTKIESRHAMVTYTIVKESVEEIYKLIEGNKD